MNNQLNAASAYFAAAPILWLTVTLLVYIVALSLYRHFNSHPLLLPVLTSVVVIVALLMATGTSYQDYAKATAVLTFLIGPATVALAVPLYGQLGRLRRMWRPIAIALAAGSLTAIVTAIGIGWLLGASIETMVSLAPKSSTMPIAVEVARVTGGLPSFTTVAVAITGIFGAVAAMGLLRSLGIRDPAVQGFALGLTSHAIGTARGFQASDTTGAFSALAMSLNGVATAILVPFVLYLLGWFPGGLN